LQRSGSCKSLYSLAALPALLLISSALTGAAHAAVWSVANNGLDSPACGTPQSPCRSLSAAINHAAPGDEIVVGPGKYGDLNGNGAIGESGEESGASGCDCLIAVNKAVVVRSTHGAAATLIDARTVNVSQAVLLSAGGEFGRPGQGFTITQTLGAANFAPFALMATGDGIAIRGNQVVGAFQNKGIGINTPCSTGAVRIEDNQVMGWSIGIQPLCANKTVRRNAILFNGFGVLAFTDQPVADNIAMANAGDGINVAGGSASANISIGNINGFSSSTSGVLTGNAAMGNNVGILGTNTSAPATGNNIFGNQCGVQNVGFATLNFTNDFWGASTGPGVDPADNVCSGLAATSPFATAPFNVPNPLPVPSVYRVNAGGQAFTAGGGVQFIADSYFNTGTTFSTTNTIAGTSDDVLYQSFRTSTSTSPELKYSFSLPNGTYSVKLHFAEIALRAAGQRVFNVKIQGANSLTNFDVFAAAGQANKAVTKNFTASVTNGTLTIEFDHVVGDPIVNAIEVLPQ
jgi:hypothetical protein